jgi:hypothetical protein
MNRVRSILSLPEDEKLSLWGGTFHSLAHRLLRIYGKKIGIATDFVILDAEDSKTLIKEISKDYFKNVELKHKPSVNLLREAIKRCPGDDMVSKAAVSNIQGQLDLDPRQVSTEDIFKAASVAVGFERSNLLTLNKTNRDRLLNYLKRYDFVLDPEILAKVERTMKLLNDNDFYHNDLTERNFMVELDDDGRIVDIYIIDFEKSSNKADENFRDDAVVKQYEVLTKSKEQEVLESKDKAIKNIIRLRDRAFKVDPEFYVLAKDSLS